MLYTLKRTIYICLLILFVLPLNAQTKSKFTQEQLQKALVRDKIITGIGVADLAAGAVFIGLAIHDFNAPEYSRSPSGLPVKNNPFKGTGKLLIGCIFAGTGIPFIIIGGAKTHNVKVELMKGYNIVAATGIKVTVKF